MWKVISSSEREGSDSMLGYNRALLGPYSSTPYLHHSHPIKLENLALLSVDFFLVWTGGRGVYQELSGHKSALRW